MKHSPKTRWIVLTVACLLWLAPAQRAFAQLSNLDITTLIEGMRAEGMNELLLHLVETENFQDPILKQQVVINQHLLSMDRYNELASKAATPQEAQKLRGQAGESLDKAIVARRQLIKDFYDNEQRPIWQTQLAMQLMGEYLQGQQQNAALFYEFGVPTTDQKQAYESAVVEALVAAENADLRFNETQSKLAQEPDHMIKRVNTGLWDRMMEQYFALRTQYILAQARYAVWLLPDDSDYFRNLNGRFARQRNTIQEERARLLAQALEVDQKLIATKAETNGILDSTQSLAGRILVAQGNIPQGMDLLAKAAQNNQPTLADLEAKLGSAFALEKQGKTSQAILVLDQLASHSLATSSLLIRLLVVDANHRVLMDAASKVPASEKSMAVSKAYEPYTRLMESADASGTSSALANYIQQRWASGITNDSDLAQLPAPVAVSMAQMLRSQGQNAINQSLRARAQNDEALASKLSQDALPKLQRAGKIADEILSRSSLTPSARASAMYEKALTVYFANMQDIAKLLEAAAILTDLGEKLPEEPRAADAMTSAMGGILHPLFAQQVGQAKEPYERAMGIMLEKFPTLPATANERYFYATQILVPQGNHDKAIEVLQSVLAGHRDYFLAQQQIIRSKLAGIMNAPDTQRQSLATAMLQDVDKLQAELGRASSLAMGEQARTLEVVTAALRIMHSDILALADQPGEAIKLLENYEQDFSNQQELVREALGKRMLMLADMGNLQEVKTQARSMMDTYPDDAAPVIDQVLTGLDKQIETLRGQIQNELIPDNKAALNQKVVDNSAAAQQLATMLLEWAKSKGLDADQMLPFELVLAKSMTMAGKADDAVKLLLPIYNKYPNDLDVLNQTGEALFMSGSRENLIKAGQIYNIIIGGVPPENNKYPPVWWNAWMRRLGVMDKLGEMTGDIGLRVRQLEMTDPQLGGEPYRSELKRLALKYSM